MVFDFFHEEAGQVLLHINRQKVLRLTMLHDALSGRGAQLVVHTRQDYLKVLWITQFAVLVRIEEFHEIITISFTGTGESVFSKKVQEIQWNDEAVLVSIETLKTAIRLKVEVRAQELSQYFNLLLEI